MPRIPVIHPETGDVSLASEAGAQVLVEEHDYELADVADYDLLPEVEETEETEPQADEPSEEE